MNNKILFMIYNDEIKFLTNSEMDHKEWYLSLGGDINNYDNVIRGFVINNQIIFFKSNLSYDQEVIDMASKCAPIMKQQLKNPSLKVCCGITPGMDGSSWEPIMTLNDNELTGFSIKMEDAKKEEAKQQEPKQEIELQPVLDFKNDYNDPKFIKLATTFTSIIIALTIIIKVLLLKSKKIDLNDRWTVLLVILQVGLLVLSLLGYLKKNSKTKYIGIAASAALFFMFDLFDIVIGVFNLFFTIDQGYILKIIDTGKNAKDAITTKISNNNDNNKVE